MGLFDKLKTISNMVLGNSAKVELLVDATVQRGKPFPHRGLWHTEHPR